MDVQLSYVANQLAQVAPLPLTTDNYPHGFDLQIRSEGRKTNYLRITPQQLKRIEAILLEQ